MKKLSVCAATIVAACFVILGPAEGAVTQVANIAALRTDVTAGSVNIDGYSAVGDGGGGQFVSNGTSCTDDGGIVIRATSAGPPPTALCWYRQFTGAVHLAWYGVTSTGDSTAALTNALTAASATLPAASRIVDTDALRFNITGISIPADVRLTCDATPGATHGTIHAPDFTTTAATIVITNTSGSINMPNNNSQFDHCILVTTGTTGSAIILNPGGITDAMSNVRNMVANGSTGVDCTGGACNINNLLIAGFDTGIEGNGVAHMKLRDNTVDADVGVFLTSLGSAVDMTGFLEISLLGGTDEADAISLVSGGTGGVCRISIPSTSSFTVTDSVDIAGVAGPVNCNGRGPVSAKGIDAHGPYIEIGGSKFAAPSTTGSWASGSQVISVASPAGIWRGWA
ncbi:MAG: hypothetical protein JOZ72_18975 [Alphaproteobacteria bacterium]|nr:hypothetical protein [Alphaproteobacteria bacterium]